MVLTAMVVTVTGNIKKQLLAVIMTEEMITGVTIRLSAPVRPRTLRVPLVLPGPGSMLMPSVRLIITQTLHLRFTSVVQMNTENRDPSIYGMVTLTVTTAEEMNIGSPCPLTSLETGLEIRGMMRGMITATMVTADMAEVVVPVLRLTHPTYIHSRQLMTTPQLKTSTRCLMSVRQKLCVFPAGG